MIILYFIISYFFLLMFIIFSLLELLFLINVKKNTRVGGHMHEDKNRP